jgi:predicted  nucleic acid-binding Zn-ribbon protein
MRIIIAKFAGKCRKCNERFEAGEKIMWDRCLGSRHTTCPEAETYDPDRARDNAEYNAGVADYNRWKEDRAMFGDEVADALDIEHDLRFGDY